MNDQKIIDNPPEGAASYTEFVEVKLNTYAKKWGGEHVFWDERLKTWTHDGWEQSSSKANFRSLADIKELVELRKANAELVKERHEKIMERLKEDALVMANARRLIKANVRTSNGRLYSEIFGTGCGSGRQASRNLGLDPDGNKTRYSRMCSYIDKALKVGV
jgi:hypothetical protein